MIFHPAILALLLGSLLVAFMVLYSTFYGVRILRKWDMNSGSEVQLGLERRTYLISTLMSYAFGFQLVSLFLFIYTADHLSPLFVGAMCGAGTLNVNGYGYPTIILKILNFLLAGLWLVVNYTDNQGYDYPLIKRKYLLLLRIAPVLLAETVLQGAYFLSMKPDIITSCCGTLFTSESQGIVGEIIGLPWGVMEKAFYAGMAGTLCLGSYFWIKGRGGYLFSLASVITFFISVIALISGFCLYFYELPTHHCPFCILQKEYGYVGYFLYLTLLGGVVTGSGVGVTMPFRKIPSLAEVLPSIQHRLAAVSLFSYLLFTVIVVKGMIFSNLTLKG
jgi:hypothetical protein